MFEIVLVVLLLLANGFFVAAEFALVRVRASQLEVLKQGGNRGAGRVLDVLHTVDSYLSAVQLGITFASLGLGWLAEPAINRHLLSFIMWLQLPISEDLSHYISFVIAFSIVSFLHIVLGEIAPKSLAIAKPIEVSIFVALPMQIFHWVFRPVMWVLTKASNGVLRLFNVQPVEAGHAVGISAEELRNIAQHSSKDGTITQEQGTLLDKVFNFSALSAREIMVQRGKICALQVDMPLDEALNFALEAGHSRYPLYRDGLDDILGFVHLKDMVAAQRSSDTATLASLTRDPVYIPETANISTALEVLQRQRSHLAIVVDEYGGTSGLVTVEDVLEELVGEIDDEFDPESQEDIRQTEDGYIVDGATLLSDLFSYLGTANIEADSDTVSGFIMEKLGRVAKIHDEVQEGEFSYTVTAMERFRIAQVFVKHKAEATLSDDDE
ncbi:MAG: hemolysin family protein [Bradymonadales bacterium]|jgi:CBS domain containing-hemolysin-like protein